MKQIERQTIESYSFLWDKVIKQDRTHFEILQNVLGAQIIKVGVGLDVGCSAGHDIEYMAKKHPNNKFVAIDITHSIYKVKKFLTSSKNYEIKHVLIG